MQRTEVMEVTKAMALRLTKEESQESKVNWLSLRASGL